MNLEGIYIYIYIYMCVYVLIVSKYVYLDITKYRKKLTLFYDIMFI